MGSAHSSPAPLVAVSAPGGRVLVPPGTAFTVHPPSYTRSSSDPYQQSRNQHRGGPVYFPSNAPQGRRHARRALRPDVDIFEGSEDSSTTTSEMMEGLGPGRPRRARIPTAGRREDKCYGGGERPRSAPEMMMGGYPGMGAPGMNGMGGMAPGGMGMDYGNMGMGVGVGPGGMGLGGMGPGGMRPGGMGPGKMSGWPPEHNSDPNIPHYGGGAGAAGLRGRAVDPYSSFPGHPPSPPSTASSPVHQPSHAAPNRKARGQERAPMGAFTGTERRRKPLRSRTEPKASERLNCNQPSNNKIRPSGKEWINGDNNFLDACICTTNCRCRKSQRVLYRSKNNRQKGGDSESEETTYDSGEIRYILKEDLGRDCDNHAGCKETNVESDREDESKRGKRRKEGQKEKKQFEGFKDELLEALDERLHQIKNHTQQRETSGPSPVARFDELGSGPNPFMMGRANMDPRLSQQIRMDSGGEPHLMGMAYAGRPPHGMSGPLGRSTRPSNMAMGGMAANGMAFEDQMSTRNMDDMGNVGIDIPYATGYTNKGPMRPRFPTSQRAAAGKFGGLNLDLDHRSYYGDAVRTRGGMVNDRRMGGNRQPHSDVDLDDPDIGPLRRNGIDRRRNMAEAKSAMRRVRDTRGGDEDDDTPASHMHVTSPPARRPDWRSSPHRGRQPHADTDDDEVY